MSRIEKQLMKINGDDVEIEEPQSRIEKQLAYILGADIVLEEPQSRIEELVQQIIDNGGGGGGETITVESLTATENKTYTAPTGKAYSPVIVNVAGGGGDLSTAKVTFINSNPSAPYTVTILSQKNYYSHDTLGMASYTVGTNNAEVDVPLYKGCYAIRIGDCINVNDVDPQVMPTSTGGVELDFQNFLMIVTGNGSFTCAGKNSE